MTLICILYAREEKSKNFLYIEGMEMTVTDCHHEKKAVQEMEHAKKFCFWERFANDRHRPTLDLHQKDAKKPEKLGNVGRCTSYRYFTHARKKVKISST